MNDIPEPSVGARAIDFSLSASNGSLISLADYRGKSNVYLFFVREFNGMQCRSHVAQLGRIYPDLKTRNFEVLLILGDTADKTVRYAESLHLPFPVLADPKRGVYQQYGLNKTLFIQRTASLIIDCDGIIRYIKTVINPTTWLQESQEVLDFIKTMSVVCGAGKPE